MSYKSLYKLYVMNDISVFNEIYNNRFNSNGTIKFDLFINDNNHSLLMILKLCQLFRKLILLTFV